MKVRHFISLILTLVITLTLIVPAVTSVQTSVSTISSLGVISQLGETINPPQLHTDGRWIKDQNNNIVFLRGVNKPSLEYRSDGAHWFESDWKIIKSWGANVVRITFNKDWWDNNIPTDDGMLYRQKIRQAVDWGKKHGIYTIISMIWWSRTEKLLPMPPDVQAWTETWMEIADVYKNETSVLFGIWNEPHDISETQWWNGAQQCVSGIRGTGAENIIIVGTLAWSDDVTFVQRIGPIGGGNIVYSFHKYPQNLPQSFPLTVEGIKNFLVSRGWKYLLDNEIAPSIVEEFGGDPTKQSEVEYIKIIGRIANGLENNSTDWRMGYVAWAFNAYMEPHPLVETDYFTPTASGNALIEIIQEGR